MTIQQKILNALEYLNACDEHYIMVVVEYGNHLDCGSMDWVTIRKGDYHWSINSHKLHTSNGDVDFVYDYNITVEVRTYFYNTDGTVQIGETLKKF